MLPEGASAQADDEATNATLGIVSDREWDHREVVRLEGSGFESSAIIRVYQCAGRDKANCVYKGGFGANRLGDIAFGTSVDREMFVDGARADCAEVSCVLQASSGTSSFGFDLEFDDRFPLPAIDVSPTTAIAPGTPITITANGFKPERKDTEAPVWLCPSEDYNQSTCDLVAMVAPDATVDFIAPRIFVTGNRVVDCAEAADSCFLRIGNYEARWALSYRSLSPLPDTTVSFSSTKELADGAEVTIDVTSPWDELVVYLCVRTIGCANVEVAEVSTAQGDPYLSQTMITKVRRFPTVGGVRYDCARAGTTCRLHVRAGTRGAVKLATRLLTYTGVEATPKQAKIKVPAGPLVDLDQVRVRVRNLIDGDSFAIFQCDADLVNCERLAGGDIPKSNFRRIVAVKETLRNNFGPLSIDCTASAGACVLVLSTTPDTVALTTPLVFG